MMAASTPLTDLLPLLYYSYSAITSHHRDGNRSAQLVLVPVLHTCASAAATSPLERACRRYGVRLLHSWASGHRRIGCKGTRHITCKSKKKS